MLTFFHLHRLYHFCARLFNSPQVSDSSLFNFRLIIIQLKCLMFAHCSTLCEISQIFIYAPQKAIKTRRKIRWETQNGRLFFLVFCSCFPPTNLHQHIARTQTTTHIYTLYPFPLPSALRRCSEFTPWVFPFSKSKQKWRWCRLWKNSF